MEIKQMVEKALAKSKLARSSDEALLDVIVLMFFQNNFNYFKRKINGKICQFISSMQRYRRMFQMKGLYPATDDIKERRMVHSKYRAEEMKAKKKDIEKMAIRKKMK